MLQSSALRGLSSCTSSVSSAQAAGRAASGALGRCPVHTWSAWTSAAKRVRITPASSPASVHYSTAATHESQASADMRPEMPPARLSDPDSASPETRSISNDPNEDDPLEHVKRRARSDTIKILNRVMRFRNKKMHALTPAQVYKLYLDEQPIDHSSHHMHPELWARLMKMAFKHQDAALARRIAADALDWSDCPLAQNFTEARNTNGDEERSIIPGLAPLPATTKNLKLLIQNILSADEKRLAVTATRKALIAEQTGADPEQVSIRSAKQKLKASRKLIKRADTGMDLDDPKVVEAMRFAWAEKLKNGPITEEIPDIKPLELSEVDMSGRLVELFKKTRHRELVLDPQREQQEQEEATLSARAIRKLRRLDQDPEKLPMQEALYLQVDPEIANEQHWNQTSRLIEEARVKLGQQNWIATLDRYHSWIQATSGSAAPVILEYVDILRNAKPAPLDAKIASRDRPRSRSEDAEQTKAQSLVRVKAEDEAARAYKAPSSDGGISRPPTYLLLATLRQLVVRREPDKALQVALSYLRTLLADVRADARRADDMFSDDAACDEIREPDIVIKPERSTAKRKAQRKIENAKLRTEYIPVKPLFLRTHGPTYSVSAPLRPPKGHEILNAVLRAHLHAGHSVRSMIQSMRALCGVRVGVAVRGWEAERREEQRREERGANPPPALSEIPIGLQREHGTLAQLLQLPANLRQRTSDWPSGAEFPVAKPHQSLGRSKGVVAAQDGNTENGEDNTENGEDTKSQHVDLVRYYGLSTSLRGKPSLTPAQACEYPRKIYIRDRIREAQAILCYPNEETFLIMLEQIRRHETSISDAVGLINTALSIWGPPPIRPHLVPFNLPIHQLSSSDSAIHKRLTAPTHSSPIDATETPYLNISTATVRKLLRWAMWRRNQWQGSRILEAGEAWIRHCREWMCAQRGAAPIFTYDPAARAPDRLDSTGQVPFTEREPTPKSSTLIPTWMWIDGGKGYLHPSASPKEARAWRQTLVSVLDKRKDDKTSEATKSEGQEKPDAIWDIRRGKSVDVEAPGASPDTATEMAAFISAGDDGFLEHEGASVPEDGTDADDTSTEDRELVAFHEPESGAFANLESSTAPDEESASQEHPEVGTLSNAGSTNSTSAPSPPQPPVFRRLACSWLSRAQVGLLAGLESSAVKKEMRDKFWNFRSQAFKMGWRTPSEAFKDRPRGTVARTEERMIREREAPWDVN